MRAMRAQWALWALWASLLVGFCLCGDTSVVVEGMAECSECAQKNIKSSDAFSGLGVTVDCKLSNGQLKNRGSGKLSNDGKFQVALPSEVVNDKGELMEDCFAQLHSASKDPCPSQNGLESSKLQLKSKENGKHTFGIAGKLAFTASTCTSACFLHHHHPHHKFPHFPWHKLDTTHEAKSEQKWKPEPKTEVDTKPQHESKHKPESESKPKNPSPPTFKKAEPNSDLVFRKLFFLKHKFPLLKKPVPFIPIHKNHIPFIPHKKHIPFIPHL